MDREKVIELLADLKERLKWQADVRGYGHYIDTINDAIGLLKEQEAVSITTDYVDGFGNRTSHCPSCNSRLVWHHNKNYCGECGRQVKWECVG